VPLISVTDFADSEIIPNAISLCTGAGINVKQTKCPKYTANTTGIGNLTNSTGFATPTPLSFTGKAVGQSVSGAAIVGSIAVIAMGAAMMLL